MNKAGIVHRKDAESAKGKLIFGFDRQKPLPIFRCLLLFSALSAECHKKVYLSVLCVSAVNCYDIFKCIVPLTPEVTPQVTPEATEQVTEQVTEQAEKSKEIFEFCTTPKSTSEIMGFLGLKHREHFRAKIIQPLLKQGLLKPTIPDKPTSSKQKYYATKEKKRK